MKIIYSGGLGNQMFQYALFLSIKNSGLHVLNDISLYSFKKMHNGFELYNVFGISKNDECKIKNLKLHIYIMRLFYKINIFGLIYKEKDNSELCNIISYKNKWIWGYWQSEKYFKNCKSIILDTFSFKKIDMQNDILANKIKKDTSISLHIRRGDYINNPIYENICNDKYYHDAISYICKTVENPIFYIFSNDILWCKNYIENFKINSVFININNDEKCYQDMYLMACCKHNIIANSSFSWWGAYLNRNINKIVISPKKWLSNKKSEDIVPKSWIKL